MEPPAAHPPRRRQSTTIVDAELFHVTSLQFSLELTWSQVSLFDANLADPFNDWNEHHLAQGFTWRPGSVSFKLPVRSGEIDVSVGLIDSLVVDPAARWAIVVPFTTWGGVIEVSSVAQSEVIDIGSGRYALLYQTGVHDGRAWAHFGLLESSVMPVEPVILRGDHEINAATPLLMQAEPAA